MDPGFTLETSSYQGPLEALLDLIEARKLSVSQVSLAEVCDAYLAYVEKLPELPIDETAQFILVASTLLVIKSRALLPTLEISEDERESVDELERRLARLKAVRAAAKTLRGVWGTAPLLLPRKAPTRAPLFAPAEATIESLTHAAQRLVASFPHVEDLARKSVAPVVALEEVVASLKKRISSAARLHWSALVRGASRHDAIVHFLAILELVRSGSASVTQDALFADIVIETEELGAPRYV